MLFEGILETTTTTGTGDLTTSAVTGRPRFSDFFAANATEGSADIFYYAITSQDSPPAFFEMGIGYCSASGTLVRAQPICTFVSGTLTHYPGTPASLPSGTKNVVCTAEAAALASAIPDFASLSGSSDRKFLGSSLGGNAANPSAQVKDRLYYVPLLLDSPRRCVALAVRNGSTAGASGTRGLHLGLYSMLRAGGPGRLLIESGDLSCGASQEIIYSFSAVRLPPGWYYGALLHDFTTAPTIGASATGAASNAGKSPLGWINSAGMERAGHCYEAIGSGWSAMPGAASASTALTGVPPSSGATPYIMLGVE